MLVITPAEHGAPSGRLIRLGDVDAYRIDRVERMEPFLTTVVSDTDLWMFISSNGALTAGRIDADHAIFPYVTDDRLHRSVGAAGPLTVIARTTDDGRELWRPFAADCARHCTRAITKTTLGDALAFEERNDRWGLTFRATWRPSGAFGWVRVAELVDHAGASGRFDVLDGLLDVMPAGVDAATEQTRSNLADAYKRSETGPWGSAALYTLESLITDRAEPGEALTAALVWSAGFPAEQPHLDERAVGDVLAGQPPRRPGLLTGLPGAYLLHGTVAVAADDGATWTIVADTGLDHATVLDRLDELRRTDVEASLAADIETGRRRLRALLSGADAFQRSADPIADAHHLSNTLFNSMRGGVFPYGHRIPVADLRDFVGVRNRPCLDRHAPALDTLGEWTDLDDLHALADATDDADLRRLVREYLPLTFSRRHGDPSRPWNRFAIRVHGEDWGELLTYEGNWRDIFQNWEALLHSYPAYFSHVVAKFLNASTADGHNPYRISRDGVDWEVPDPDDPWSNIGYWGDHQIVYLLRLLQGWARFAPGELDSWFDRRDFVYADVPYTIAGHDAMVRDPQNTISFDERRAEQIERQEAAVGTDGRLVVTVDGELLRAGLLEKLLVPALGKLTAFVPGGGIWMNTQRPEWNDANNALAGNGLSMVTLAYLVEYVTFLRRLAARRHGQSAAVSTTTGRWLRDLAAALDAHDPARAVDPGGRRRLVDALGSIGTAHRGRLAGGVTGETVELSLADVERFCATALAHLEPTLRAARRPDGLYHSYNRISFPSATTARVDPLGPMLEGQVAVLSSGILDGRAALDVVDALYESAMYRADQRTFMLYPATSRPPFLARNTLTAAHLADAPFLATPLDERWRRVFAVDRRGGLHFRPACANGAELHVALDQAGASPDERAIVERIYEELFEHASFTGRSGAMYGYEGIGSIYWHMVAKLLLAVQEHHAAAVDRGDPPEVVDGLAAAYRRIRDGLGFRTSPDRFGAFPTDCYSHTPAGGGAKQPGMTGQVKEEILTRFGEIGIRVVDGAIRLGPCLLDPAELFGADASTSPLALSLCQVPLTIAVGGAASVTTVWADGRVDQVDGAELSAATSAEIFGRTGAVERIEFTVDGAALRPDGG